MSFENYTPGRKVRVGPRKTEPEPPAPCKEYKLSPEELEEIREKYGEPNKAKEKLPINLSAGKKGVDDMKKHDMQQVENKNGIETITAEKVDQNTESPDMTKLINWLNMPEQVSQERGTYEVFGQTIGRLVDEKQKAYGNAFQKIGQISKILYPSGVPVEKLDDFALIVRVLDKLCRIADGDKKAFEESPWRDVAGYGLLGYVEGGHGSSI